MTKLPATSRVTGALAAVLLVPAGGAAAYTTPARPSESASDLPAVAEQQRFRAELGMPASAATVKDLNARWVAGQLPGAGTEGAVFTAEEKAEVDERDAAGQEIAGAARRYFAPTDLRPAFGGVFIDHSTGHVVVLVTRDASGHAAALRRHVRHPDRLEVRTVRFALADLERITAELTAKAAEMQAAGVDFSTFGPNEVDNAVDVNLIGNSAKARAIVLGLLRPGDAAMVRFFEAAPVMTNEG